MVIGIQARTSSTRLPNKTLMPINGKPIVQHIIDSCGRAIGFIDKDKWDINIELVLLIPEKDELKNHYQWKIKIVEGSEQDVLSRYVKATKVFEADYICRITADCVFISTPVITKHIKSALINKRDLTTNTHIRTFKEGYDCEIVIKKSKKVPQG